MNLLDKITFNNDGLVAAIAQDAESGRVLMMAWMNAEAFKQTVETGHAVYFSRSRGKLWHKGESSGNQQIIRDIRLDCDGDTLLLLVEQRGGVACHTGRESCFYLQPSDTDSATSEWQSVDPVLKTPEEMYGKKE